MTKDEAITKLGALDGDQEIAHGEADDCLVEFLRTNGFAEVADAYEAARQRIGFWYA